VFERLVDALVLQKLAVVKVDVVKNMAQVSTLSADSGYSEAGLEESGQPRVEMRVLLMRGLSLLQQG
jgi:hypothetical protein